LDTPTEIGVTKKTPNLSIPESKETIPDPKTASIAMTDKGDASASPLVMNNPAGNDIEESKTIATTNKGNASAHPILTSILTGNTFQTTGQLLKAMTEANLIFNEGGGITITNREDSI
jgi:hypothetical protein